MSVTFALSSYLQEKECVTSCFVLLSVYILPYAYVRKGKVREICLGFVIHVKEVFEFADLVRFNSH